MEPLFLIYDRNEEAGGTINVGQRRELSTSQCQAGDVEIARSRL